MLMRLCGAAVVVVVVAVVVGGEEVHVSGGVVKGAVRRSATGREYHAFSAIPYAHPPIDRRRFMPPVPGVQWDGVLDASKDGPPCAQAALGIEDGVEDCLNLYVYTPKLPSKGENISLPVVVWLHGGSFVVGGAAALDESRLMDRDLVLVVPQYRLGLLGFFLTPRGTSPGNMGMMDQTMALSWVQESIAAFGGNPGQVTLAGDCAGGASAIYHMMSPLSKGLFHRVVSLSGSPLSPWALYQDNHRFMLILANYIKCPAHDQNLTVKCFQEVTVEELLDPVQMLCESRDLMVGNHRLAPSVQIPANNHETTLFLSQHPLHAITQGELEKVPVLMTVTKDVGAYLVDMLLYDFMIYKLEDNPDFLSQILSMLLKESYIPDPDDHEKMFHDFYFPGIKFNNLTSILPGMAEMLGDIQYKAGVLSAASLLSEHVPTRVLRFEYEGGPHLFFLRHPDPDKAPPMPLGVGHGDEMALILPDQKQELDDEQEKASKELIDMIENFAYGRAPRDEWPLFDSKKQESLVLGADGSFSTQPFTSPARAQMLQKIHALVHQKALKTLAEEENRAHDEL